MQIRPLEDSDDDDESDDIPVARATSSSLYRQEFEYMTETMNTRQFEEMNVERESDKKFIEVNDFLDLRKSKIDRARHSSHHSNRY